ncbi:MAG: type IV toxin-antitoxin system AbiEi family antitoxin domain-containing protein [Rugosibacter sp.]
MENHSHRVSGLGKLDRERLSAVLRGTKGTITNEQAAKIMTVGQPDASKLLARWCKKGWLSRVARGLYVPVPMEAERSDLPLDDPWLVAVSLYSPCYIGGWSAAEHWDLTEQIFRTTMVMTTTRPRNRKPTFKGAAFWISTVAPEKMFGLKTVWRGSVKVSVSDPSRTVLDMLSDPQLGGGIRSVQDMFRNYLSSDAKNLGQLMAYAERLGNGAVFKRLGFLLEANAPQEVEAIEGCRHHLTMGNACIDPKMPAEALAARWRLWVPRDWKAGVK